MSESFSGCIISEGGRDPGTHLPGGWVCLKADMDVVVKELNLVASLYGNCSSVYCANI